MAQTIFLRGASQLLTLRGPASARRGSSLQDLGIIADGSMLIRDGLVLCVGPTRRIENLKAAKSALEVPVFGKVVMPGLVDAALHLSLRSSQNTQRLKRVADFHDDSLTLLRSCLQHGTVSADVKVSADGRDFHSDIAVLRKLVRIGSNPVRVTRTWRIGVADTFPEPVNPEECRITFDTLLRRKFIDSILLTPHAEADFDSDLVAAAQEAGVAVKLRWNGQNLSIFQTLLQRLRPQTVAFADPPSPLEVTAIVQTSAITVLAAGKQVFEGLGGTAGRDLIDAGASVALSSGYDSTVGSSSSMQMAIALAVARLGFTPEEAFTAATINAAYAAGCGDSTGSLEAGKQADALVLNISDYRELPLQFGINHIAMVFRQGNIVLNRTKWRPPAEPQALRVRTQLR